MKIQAYRHPSSAFRAELARRRGKLLERLSTAGAAGSSAACIVQGAVEGHGSSYARNLFKQESHYHSLTGVEQEGGVAVFAPAASEKAVLFLPARDSATELWNGPMVAPEVAAGVFGFDAAYPLSELAAKLPELLKGSSCVYASRAQGLAAETDVAAGLQGARLRQKGIEWRESSYLLGELRLVKSEWEIAQLREACRLGSRMHEIAMRRGRPGRHEYELQAWMEGFARENGSLWMGYASIVASGENATCLHYGVNNCRLEEGEVVLVDAGCEWNGFTSDITRTFPASGRFSKEQRALYEVVLRAQKEAIARVRPGATLKELSEHATAVLVEGLLSLGLLAGDARVLLEGKEHKAFYPHSLSHWLGIDVHDVGAYEAAGSDRPLEPGMCFTIEPGLYIQPDNEAVAAVWRGLGIRIEDDILVTADGCENLVDCPKEVEEVEALCR